MLSSVSNRCNKKFTWFNASFSIALFYENRSKFVLNSNLCFFIVEATITKMVMGKGIQRPYTTPHFVGGENKSYLDFIFN